MFDCGLTLCESATPSLSKGLVCLSFQQRVEFRNSSQTSGEVRLLPVGRTSISVSEPFQTSMSLSATILPADHTTKCELAAEVLRSTGTLRLQVTGWSMLPSVFPGDTLIIDRTDSAAARDGDIVLVARNGRLFAHRLVETPAGTGEGSITTRGDSMALADPPVGENNLLGRVSFIVRNGSYIKPRRTLRVAERALAAIVQHSETAARVVVRVHSFRQRTQDPNA